MNDHGDLELEQRAARGDRAAFDALFERLLPRAYDFVLRMGVDEKDAADLIEQAFIRVLQSEPAGGVQFATRLFDAARGLVLSRSVPSRRAHSAVPDEEYYRFDPDRLDDPEDAAGAFELAPRVWRASEDLTLEDRVHLHLHVREGMRAAELGWIVGVSDADADATSARLTESLNRSVSSASSTKPVSPSAVLRALSPMPLAPELASRVRDNVWRAMQSPPPVVIAAPAPLSPVQEVVVTTTPSPPVPELEAAPARKARALPVPVWLLGVAAIAVIAIAVAAFFFSFTSGDDDFSEARNDPQSTERTPDRAPTVAAGVPDSEPDSPPVAARSPVPSPSRSPTPQATTTPAGPPTEADRLRAAIRARSPDIGFDPECSQVIPRGACATGTWSEAELTTGIASVSVSTGQEGIASWYGRTADGTWVFWFVTQNSDGPQTELPGDMIVCADGDGLNLRAEPSTSAAVVALIPDGTVVRGDRFVMTDPPTPGGTGQPHPDGWYHIISPQEGWAFDRFLLAYTPAVTTCIETWWP